jgi:hypothetical protein
VSNVLVFLLVKSTHNILPTQPFALLIFLLLNHRQGQSACRAGLYALWVTVAHLAFNNSSGKRIPENRLKWTDIYALQTSSAALVIDYPRAIFPEGDRFFGASILAGSFGALPADDDFIRARKWVKLNANPRGCQADKRFIGHRAGGNAGNATTAHLIFYDDMDITGHKSSLKKQILARAIQGSWVVSFFVSSSIYC